MIQFVSGDWSTATSITGAVSGATANIAGFVSPSYGIGDKVIWGGYSWTNANGNISASVDVLNLNAEWTKNVYDTFPDSEESGSYHIESSHRQESHHT